MRGVQPLGPMRNNWGEIGLRADMVLTRSKSVASIVGLNH